MQKENINELNRRILAGDFSNIKIENIEETPYISYNILKSEKFCTAGFSTRLGGVSKGIFESMNLGFNRGDIKENVYRNFLLLGKSAGFIPEDVCLPNQCHLNKVRVVTEAQRGSGILSPKVEEPFDAQITNVPGIVLIAYGADCVPVYLCDPVNKCIGLAHAGWRGTVLNIVNETLKAMKKEYGTEISNVKAVIGPSICQSCYEVGAEVAEEFMSYSDKVVLKKNDEKFLLNLWQANKENLVNSGIKEENISISGLCTKCNHELFFSHRFHHNDRGSNAAFLFIKR